METTMNKGISTTREQSTRLLQCGVSAESADMYYQVPITLSQKQRGEDILLLKRPGKTLYNIDTPAWSLSALISMIPSKIEIDEDPCDEIQEYGLLIYPFMGGWQIDYQYCIDDECHCLKCIHSTDIIEVCVKAIEWLTANNYKLNQL